METILKIVFRNSVKILKAKFMFCAIVALFAAQQVHAMHNPMYLASGLGDGTIRLLDLSKEEGDKEIRVLRGHKFSINSVIFHPMDPNILVSAGVLKNSDMIDLI